MDPVTIGILVQTLGPIFIPIVTSGITWLFNKIFGAMSPQLQSQINPFLPVVAAGLGGVLANFTGQSTAVGMVGGLAGTGIHQAITQPVKAAKKVTPNA